MSTVPDAHVEPVEHLAPSPGDETHDGSRHLRAVPPRRRRQPRVGLWIGSVVSCAALFLLVAFNVFMVQGQFDLDRIAEQHALEQKRYEKNRATVAALASPESIVGKARGLGLVDPGFMNYVEAPAAGALEPPPDRTLTTQQETWGDAKGALGASP